MHRPPQFFLKLFRWFCHPKLRSSIEGDLIELYNEHLQKSGTQKARIKFAWDVLLLFRPGVVRPLSRLQNLNTADMLKMNFKLAFRSLLKNRGFSLLNISGLTIAMVSAILIMLWVNEEWSVDRFHENKDRIVKLYSRDYENGSLDVWPNTPSLMAPELKQSYPQVEDAVRERVVFFLLKKDDNHFNEQGSFVDPGFLKMFSFPMLKGSKDALYDDSGIVLTKDMAIKLFGTTECLGQTVVVNDNDDFQVSGVLDANPGPTDFQFSFLLPWSYMTRLGWDRYAQWSYTNVQTYALMKDRSLENSFDEQIIDIVKKHVPIGDGSSREIISQPLSKAHLYTSAENGELTGGRIENVRIFITISILILIIGCINFMNLTAAKSAKRAREVGIRKIAGARKNSLVNQFIIESTAFALVSFLLSIGIVQLLLSPFNKLIDATIKFDLSDSRFWFASVIVVIATGVLSGFYPALRFSSSRPSSILRNSETREKSVLSMRKVLVVIQFVSAVAMIICTLTIRSQIQFAQSRDMGYQPKNLAYNFTQGEVPAHFESIRHDLIASGAATSVTRTFSPVNRIWSIVSSVTWQGSTEEDKNQRFIFFGADKDLVQTLGVTVIQGRDLDIDKYPSDTMAILLNETALGVMNFKDPIGQVVSYEGYTFHIVGVIKDFIIDSPYDPIEPMIIQGWTPRYGVVNFRLNPDKSTKDNLATAEKIFSKYNPEYPFEYYFADDYYNRKFGNEEQVRTLIALFSALTILVSCLGLFGLSAFMAEQRTKEIGVRKVLGASIFNLWSMLSKEFLVLVIISIGLAIPISYYFMHNWLQGFAYRINLSAWLFITSGALALIITLLTVSYQTIKAALTNPVDSLRSE